MMSRSYCGIKEIWAIRGLILQEREQSLNTVSLMASVWIWHMHPWMKLWGLSLVSHVLGITLFSFVPLKMAVICPSGSEATGKAEPCHFTEFQGLETRWSFMKNASWNSTRLLHFTLCALSQLNTCSWLACNFSTAKWNKLKGEYETQYQSQSRKHLLWGSILWFAGWRGQTFI